jgi:CelD/BcsL family acetyltransferase involved in cellulose biosynthesis
MEPPEVFYTWEWARSAHAAYHAVLKPLLFLGYNGDKLAGVASLAIDAAADTITFLTATTADYCDFLSAPENRAEFAESVFAELGKIQPNFIALANLPENSMTTASVQGAARKNKFHLFMRSAYLCARVELGSSNQRSEMKSTLNGKKKFRRYLREMERKGRVTFAHLQSEDEIRRALPEFADAHVARFRETGRMSSLSTPERRFFLEELVRRFAGAGIVTLSELRIGDRPVAWNYGFQFHGSWFWYQPTFDSREEENSPGICLLARIIAEACDIEAMKIIDLGLGAEGYKERFGNGTRQTLYVTATKSRRRHLWEIIRYHSARLLKQSPKVESALRRLLNR